MLKSTVALLLLALSASANPITPGWIGVDLGMSFDLTPLNPDPDFWQQRLGFRPSLAYWPMNGIPTSEPQPQGERTSIAMDFFVEEGAGTHPTFYLFASGPSDTPDAWLTLQGASDGTQDVPFLLSPAVLTGFMEGLPQGADTTMRILGGSGILGFRPASPADGHIISSIRIDYALDIHGPTPFTLTNSEGGSGPGSWWVVPEPSTWGLMALGFAFLAWRGRAARAHLTRSRGSETA
jgi:hypothetical protein